MTKKRLVAGVATLALVGGGTAGAIAATGDHKAAEQAVLSDAAKELGVSADELRSALANAEDAQLDAAVKAGELTQEQADEIKRHRQDEGTVLGLGPHGPGGPGGPPGGPHGPGGPPLFEDAAKALGITVEQLGERLRDGESLAEIAKAENTTLAAVKTAVKEAAIARLDAALKAGDITQAQRDEQAERLDDEISRLGDHPRHGPGPGPGGPPPRP